MAGKYNKNFALLLNTILEMSEQQQDQLLKHAIGIKDNRHKSRVPCLIYAKHDVGGESENSFILDINTYGAFVETEKDFKKGENIYISFFDPFNNRTIRITGNIVRKENNGFGVHFDTYSFLMECLDEFLSELTKFRGAVINNDSVLHAFGIEV
jgi:hypothetical protein